QAAVVAIHLGFGLQGKPMVGREILKRDVPAAFPARRKIGPHSSQRLPIGLSPSPGFALQIAEGVNQRTQAAAHLDNSGERMHSGGERLHGSLVQAPVPNVAGYWNRNEHDTREGGVRPRGRAVAPLAEDTEHDQSRDERVAAKSQEKDAAHPYCSDTYCHGHPPAWKRGCRQIETNGDQGEACAEKTRVKFGGEPVCFRITCVKEPPSAERLNPKEKHGAAGQINK